MCETNERAQSEVREGTLLNTERVQNAVPVEVAETCRVLWSTSSEGPPKVPVVAVFRFLPEALTGAPERFDMGEEVKKSKPQNQGARTMTSMVVDEVNRMSPSDDK